MKKLWLLPALALSLGGCGPLGAALGMGAAGGLLSSVGASGLLNGSAGTPSLSQEFADVEAVASLVHKHEMIIAAIVQTPVVTTVPMPVMVTPGTTLTPPVVGTPGWPQWPAGMPPVVTTPGKPLPPRPAGSPPPVVGNPP